MFYAQAEPLTPQQEMVKRRCCCKMEQLDMGEGGCLRLLAVRQAKVTVQTPTLILRILTIIYFGWFLLFSSEKLLR